MPRWPTAAVLNLIEPMNVGMGGDLFAIIYVAKDHKLHVLNASGMAPSGATLGITMRSAIAGIRTTGARARACRSAASCR